MRALPLLLCLLLLAGCRKPTPPDPTQQAEGYYLRGTAAFLAGDFSRALEAYTKVRELNPDDRRIDAAEGEVMLVSGRLKEALERFERAAKLDPERGATWGRIAFIREQLGEHDAAREALDRALELHPEDYESLETLARLELAKGRLDEAVAAYVRAADAIPAPAGAGLMLEAAGVLSGAQRSGEALTLLTEGISRGHLSGEVARTLGDLQVEAGALRDALESYQLAAKLLPGDPVPWELVGEIWAALGRPTDAAAAYRESLRVQNRAEVHLALVKLALDHGQRDDAERAFEGAQAALTGTREELLAVADTLERLGRKEDAAAVRKQLEETDATGGPRPSSPETPAASASPGVQGGAPQGGVAPTPDAAPRQKEVNAPAP
ncbi:MAG TPA: tetratricopeptide repeat protein [Myxococcaceae bacterium]|nr:tetratricopeptide repeat protein [Myxococcaceae bacterium]